MACRLSSAKHLSNPVEYLNREIVCHAPLKFSIRIHNVAAQTPGCGVGLGGGGGVWVVVWKC